MEILNLIAKVSWETNTRALEQMSSEMKRQDGSLEELRKKGQRLNEQLIKTNDPKKIKSLNDELQRTKRSVDSIIESQKKQASTLDSLNKKQADLVDKLRSTNDPKLVQGLLRNLKQVENQMSVLDNKATSLPSKLGGIGKSLLQGLGIGAGAFGLQAALGAISSFVSDSIAEFEDAQKTALDLDRALKVIGKGKYFEGLVTESTNLAKAFSGLFDNDEIIKAQTALVQYGKLSRAEMSQLLPVILNLATQTGSVETATQSIVNILEGRGGQTLRDYGVSVKGVKTEHDRLNVVLGDFATKLTGAADDYAKTAQGIQQTNRVLVGNIEEQFGESFGRLKNKFLPFITSLLNGINDALEGTLNLAYVGDDSPEIKKLKERIAQRKAFQALQSAGGAGLAFDRGAINPNAQLSEDEVKKEVKKKVKTAQQLAKEKENEIILQARIRLGKLKPGQSSTDDISGEIERINKEIADKNRRGQEAQSVAFDSDSKRENMLGILTDDDVRANELKNDILTQQYKKAEEERLKIAKEASDERKKIEREDLFNNTIAFASELSNFYSNEIRMIDGVISAQERRVEAAKTASDKSLKIEQDRLDDLTAKRERYERRQRTIDAAIVVANQAIAISYAIKGIAKAASEGGAGAALTVASNVVAIGAGILASTAAIRAASQDGGFKDGGYTGDGDPSEVSTNLGKRGYKYHKKEFVMNEHLTSKHRDMLEGMHTGSLIVNKLNDGYYLTNRTIDTEKAISDHYNVKNQIDMRGMEQQLQSINERLQGFKVNVNNNLDVDGFSQKVAVGMGRINILNKQRGG